jgi:starch-binding outer membrane protein, SusD/RagB family
MRIPNYIKISSLLLLTGIAGCTKLNEKYESSFTSAQITASLGTTGTTLLLQGAYTDIGTPFTGQDEVFSLEENTADECLVPTRGGDWDDNGVWRVLHNHSWDATHGQILQVFNNLNKLNFDATNVLQFGPTKEQAAEARFLRALSLYYLLDLFNQYPVRNPGDNLLNAPKVYTGDSAVLFVINELTTILPDLGANNTMNQANSDAAKMLLMKLYLNRGAYDSRNAPTFADADMQQVITLGNQIINGGKYKYMSNYFDNFAIGNNASTEGIFAYANSSGVSANNSGPDARWMMTFHYNEYDGQAPNAGWNGFSTISDFYNAFSLGGTTNYTPADTIIDTRLGGRTTSNATSYKIAGIRPGFLVGQQHDQNGVALKDRKGNPLAFDPTISPTMIETGSNLEVTGIRVDKYPPDFSNTTGQYYSANSGNWIMIMRYPEVVLMVAEAYMRQATPNPVAALALINGLRTARGASTVASMPLVNTANVEDPTTLLAERGRELYYESVRRTDLLRFGMFTQLWQYKTADDPHYEIFPIPSEALAVDPNLKQNTGYN